MPLNKRMTRQEQEVLNKRVVQFYLNYQNDNEKIKIKKTCDHFIEEGFYRFTIQRIIKRFNERK